MVTIWTSLLSLIDQALLHQPLLNLYIASEIVETSQDCVFEILNRNSGSTMQRLQKYIVVTYVVAAPALLVPLLFEPAALALEDE